MLEILEIVIKSAAFSICCAARAGEVTATGICVDRSEKIRKRHAVHGVYGGRKRR